jgi:hypothetical protein
LVCNISVGVVPELIRKELCNNVIWSINATFSKKATQSLICYLSLCSFCLWLWHEGSWRHKWQNKNVDITSNVIRYFYCFYLFGYVDIQSTLYSLPRENNLALIHDVHEWVLWTYELSCFIHPF